MTPGAAIRAGLDASHRWIRHNLDEYERYDGARVVRVWPTTWKAYFADPYGDKVLCKDDQPQSFRTAAEAMAALDAEVP